MGDTDLTVLVVDDDFRVANMHAEVVKTLAGFTVIATVNTLEAARKADAVDLALVDVYLPDGSGIDFVRELHGDSMVLTAATEAVTIQAAMSAGALSYLVKPFSTTELAARLSGWEMQIQTYAPRLRSPAPRARAARSKRLRPAAARRRALALRTSARRRARPLGRVARTPRRSRLAARRT